MRPGRYLLVLLALLRLRSDDSEIYREPWGLISLQLPLLPACATL